MELTDRDIYIEQLMMEKLAGIISREDAAQLEELIKSDAAADRRWRDLKDKFVSAGSQQFLDGIDTASALSRLRQLTENKQPRRRITPYKVAIAASLLIAVALGVTYHFHAGRPLPSPLAVSAVPDNSVKLYLSGNRAITLTRDATTTDATTTNTTTTNTTTTNTTDLKAVKLNIGNGSLSYVPLNGETDNSLNTLVVPATRSYDLVLEDGIEVRMNSESSLKFPFTFSSTRRELWVTGEAYFKVSKDAHRPLIVHTPAYDILVLGTEFNVNSYDSSHTSTALVAGAVNASAANGRTIVLKPGYLAVLGKANSFQVKSFDPDNELSWMKGEYFFQNVLLRDIAPAIRRWYGIDLVFDDPSVAQARFTGALRKSKPLDEFLENLFLVSKIDHKTVNGSVHLYAR